MKLLTIVFITLFASIGLAAEAQASIPWIDKIIALIPTDASVIAMIGMVLELILRVIPSAQPLSIIYWIADICRNVAVLLAAVGSFLDKVLGQRTAAPKVVYMAQKEQPK